MNARVCYLCDSNCRWCRYSSSSCLQCKDTDFLLDLHAECVARFLTPGTCTKCSLAAYNMCNNAAYLSNRKCLSSCPTYMYFHVYRTGYTSADYQSIDFGEYAGYMTAS